MNPKKLCSLGILDININLILTESQAEKYEFNIDDYNTVSDLKNLFYPLTTDYNTEIDYFKHVFLSSENNLINTLLYINRAYKPKTFIEFIMPNKLDFGSNTKFVHNLLIDVCNMNYLFIVENKIIDVNSNIKFNINIIDEETKENIETKTFDLFEMNDLEIKINNNENDNENLNEINDSVLFNLDYNFDKADFFLVDLFSYKELLYKNKYDIEQFLYKVIGDNKQIKIILIINKNCFTGYDFTSLIEKYREIIELSDIIFCDRKEINYFLKTYNNLKNCSIDINNGYSGITSKNNTMINNNNNYLPGINKDLLNKKIPYNLINNTNENSNLDLLIFDNEKHRKSIPRISILFDSYFSSITLYEQNGTHMEIETKETFHFKLKQEKVDLILKSGKIYYYIFIGGFLSRLIHNKSFRVCFYAGYLLLEKIFKNTIKKKNIFKIDDYNVLVPNEKKGLKDKLIKLNEKILEEQKCKEKGFVLDCTNLNECKIKIYNPLLDTNCASYLLKKNIFEHLRNKGFINKNGIVLKDPDKYEKNKFNIAQKKKKIKPIFLDYDNFKLPVIQNNNNICLTAKKTNEYFSLKKINKDKEKTYYKTINNFYGQKKLNVKPNPYNYKNINDNSKTKNKLKTGLFNENNKMEEYSLRTTKNFKFKKNINSNPKKKIVINNIKLNEVKNKLDLTRNKKIPKYEVYSKHLFQLYKPDIKLANDLFEIKNKSHKKKKLKRVYSHS